MSLLEKWRSKNPAFWLSLSLIFGCLFISLSLPHADPGDLSYDRDVSILGWKPDGSELLFQEKTQSGTSLSERVALLNTRKGEVLRNLTLRQPQDTLKEISERESEVRDLFEKGKFVKGTPAQVFIGAHQSGFLSPEGRFLVTAEFTFKRKAKNKEQQILTTQFYILPLDGEKKQQVATVEIESIDGEHFLTLDSVGAVTVSHLEWAPKTATAKGEIILAVLLEEKRTLYRVKGVVPLNFNPALLEKSARNAPAATLKEDKIIAMPRPPESKEAPKAKKEEPPKPVKNLQAEEPAAPAPTRKANKGNAKPAAPESSDRLSKIYLPTGGEAEYLRWEPAHVAASEDGAYTAVQHYFSACVKTPKNDGQIFSSNLSVLDRSDASINYSLSPSLNPKKLKPFWNGEALELRYLDEPLRAFSISREKFSNQELFAIQLASLTSRDAAKQEVEKLCAQGLPAYYLVIANGDSAREVYRLRVGRFESEAKARSYAQNKLSTLFPKYLLTRF